MLKRMMTGLLVLGLLSGTLTGCGAGPESPLDRNNPTLLTFCHSYTAGMQGALDELVEDFNGSYGRKNGIAVRAVAVDAAEGKTLLQQVIAGGEDAPAMPDLVMVDRQMGAQLLEAGLVTGLDERFTDTQLDAYAQRFLDACRYPDGQLYLFPVAQTTEVLFVNRPLFEKFAGENGLGPESLDTLEGISDTSVAYYYWTAAQATGGPDDGEALFAADSWLRYLAAGVAQQGGALLGSTESLQSTEFQRVWQTMIGPGLIGGYTGEGRPSRLFKEAQLVCYTGPASDIGLYSNYQLASLSVLPYPLMTGGEAAAPLVGEFAAVARATEEKEYAAAQFLLWLTEPKQNLRLVTGTGYLPVTVRALEDYTAQPPKGIEDAAVLQLLETVAEMYGTYRWEPTAVGDSGSAGADVLESSLQWVLHSGRQRVRDGESVPAVSDALALEFIASGGDLREAIARAAATPAADAPGTEPEAPADAEMDMDLPEADSEASEPGGDSEEASPPKQPEEA